LQTASSKDILSIISKKNGTCGDVDILSDLILNTFLSKLLLLICPELKHIGALAPRGRVQGSEKKIER
jgi:hypothetical protein